MRAYVFIEARAGMSKRIKDDLGRLTSSEARVLSVDVVAGRYDVVTLLEAEDLPKLGRTIAASVQGIDGVTRTMTCVAI